MTIGRIPSVEGGIQPTIVDAKGDLIVGTAADSVARLAVGTNGYTLVADSVETTGLKWAAPSTGSLVHINTTSFSAVSSQSVNDVFSASYDTYKIIIEFTDFGGATNAQVKMKMRVSGADNSDNNYYTTNYSYAPSSFTDLSANPTTTGFLVGQASSSDNEGGSLNMIDIMDPYLATETTLLGIGQTFLSNTGVSNAYRFSGTKFGQTSWTGFTLIPASSTITGRVRVYGYQN